MDKTTKHKPRRGEAGGKKEEVSGFERRGVTGPSARVEELSRRQLG